MQKLKKQGRAVSRQVRLENRPRRKHGEVKVARDLAEAFCCPDVPSCSPIVDIAVGNPDFSTLVAALTAADLVDALSGDGPFTVFGKLYFVFCCLHRII